MSPQDVRSHRRFREKYALPFALLADPGGRIASRYGVWVEKQMFGRRYMGIARTTFIIDPEGRIARVFEKVDPDGPHADEVAAALAQLA